MKILIVRHAEPDYQHDSLTPKGFREAQLLAERLSKMNLSNLYCSPCGRAIRTAKPTANLLGKDIEILDWLTEFRGKIIDEEGRFTIPWNRKPQVSTSGLFPEFFGTEGCGPLV